MYSSLHPRKSTGTTKFLGLPMMQGIIALGASSPEKPALATPDPLSITIGYFSSTIFETIF
jgi:hypothetical protein